MVKSKMRVLFISRWYPYPPDNGSRIRVFNLIQQLSRQHEITLLSFAQEPVSPARLAEMEPYCHSVHTVPYQQFNSGRLKALIGLFSTRPRSQVDTYSREMHDLVKGAGSNNSFDVVIASQRDCAPYAILLKRTPRVFEEVELATIHEQFIRQHSLISRIRYGLTWWKYARYMSGLLSTFDGCTVVSEQEQELILSITPDSQPPIIVPNGVDLTINTGNFGAIQPDTLIYSGALTYDANFDAMEFFLRDIFPLVKTQRPGVRMRITGGYNGVPVERLPLGDGVELTGYLNDIQSAVAQSCVCVVPLRMGGGTRLKILEAMALGTPVVSTSKGADGLEITHGQDILIANDPGDFAQTLVQLLGDENLRAKLSANGRRLVEEKYSWETCVHQLEQLLCRIVGQEIQQHG